MMIICRNQNPWVKVVSMVAALFLAASGGVAAPAKATKAPAKKASTSAKPEVKKHASNEDSDDDDDKSAKSSTKDKTAKAEPITTQTPETLPGTIDNALKGVINSSRWGIKVVLADTGQVLYEHDPNGKFIPASCRKLFTGAFALDQLGPDFKFQTYLYRTGAIDAAGTLNGSLVIRPQGDPTFNNQIYRNMPEDWIYRNWVEKVKAENIKSVSGELIVDCSEWNLDDLKPAGWAARIRQDNYAPQTSPLTVGENIMGVRVRPGADGQPGIIDFQPPADGYPVINRTVTGGKGGISVRKLPDGSIEVTGSPSSKTAGNVYSVPCDRPTLYAAAVFRHYLLEAGIHISGSIRIAASKRAVPPPTTENVIAMYPSPPLSDVIKEMMKHSDNHFAEQLYVAVSAIKTANGGYDASKRLESAFLTRVGISPKDLNFEDGSGLSESNAVSPAQYCTLLTYMMRQPYAQAFFNSLPVGGQDGTLRGRMQGARVKGRVLAKTGHINYVNCLSGYIVLAPQKTVVFSFLVNNIKTSTGYINQMQDRLCEIISQLQI